MLVVAWLTCVIRKVGLVNVPKCNVILTYKYCFQTHVYHFPGIKSIYSCWHVAHFPLWSVSHVFV